MKIATWNVNSIKVRLPQVRSWLRRNQPDVLLLQELKFQNDELLSEAFGEDGFAVVCNSGKTYNGVAVISRLPAREVQRNIPGFDDEQKRLIAATIAGIRVINIYAVNGEALDSPKFIYKKQWFDALIDYVREQSKIYPALLLAGDFNIAPADIDVAEPEKRRGLILCSDEERKLFRALLDSGLHDSLRELDPGAHSFTWWDYRLNSFKRDLGMRIDHILLSDDLMAGAISFGIDRDARAAERPSDHAPVTVELRS